MATGYTVMDGAIDNIKEMVKKSWDNNIYPIICTLTPRSDITPDGCILFDYFNDWVKTYATEQSMNGKECAYIDMFNAGKDFDPPEPLEDPNKPYHLNLPYDGDNVFDESGTQIKSGLGVHMSPDGYRVMGYAVPLTLFQTNDIGIHLFKDTNCNIEETYNTDEVSNPFYEVTIENVRRGTEKEVIKYLKNVGNNTVLYYVYITDEHNMKYYFINDNGEKVNALSGTQTPGFVRKMKLMIESEFDDYKSDFRLHILSREIKTE